MKIIALSAGASFLIVGAVVGVRMLLLARRTGSRPELLLGAGLTALTFVTLPAVGLSLGAGVGSLTLQLTLFTIGLVPVFGFVVCLHAFTALVFRAGQAWATALVWSAGTVAAAGMAGTVWTRIGAWHFDGVVGVYWSAALVGPIVLGMLWTGVESALYFVRLRRRVVIRLADPIVCNRFLLWAIGNLGGAAGTVVVVISLFLGWRVVEHPVPILGTAVAGLLLSTSWSLAFLPPEGYLQHVRGRSGWSEL